MNPLTPALNSTLLSVSAGSMQSLKDDLSTLDAKFEATPSQWPTEDLTRQARDLAGRLAYAGAGLLTVRNDTDGRNMASELITVSTKLFESIGRANAMRNEHIDFGERVGYGNLLNDAIFAASTAARLLSSTESE